MDLHERQQFDFLLQTAAERLVARLEERHRGPEPALPRLREDPGEVAPFVDAVFADFLLDNADGACLVLRAVARQPAGPIDTEPGATVEAVLVLTAKRLFAGLLTLKAEELLEQHSGYQSV